MSDVTLASVDQLIALCKSLTPPIGVSLDPAQVNTPGGWLAIDEVRPCATLAGDVELRCSLYLIAADVDPRRALGKLVPMLTQLGDVLSPDGPVTPQGVVLPDSPTPLPALRVPLFLYE